MNINEINLARGLVWNARQRRRIYWGMVAYLLVASLLLIFTAGRVTRRIQESEGLIRRTQALQSRFQALYPGHPGMEIYAGKLKEDIQKKSVWAAAINSAMPPSVYSSLSLLNLMAGGEQNGRINKLSFEQCGKINGGPELTFSIMVANAVNGVEIQAHDSLQQWRNDPVLARDFSAITPMTTERGSSASEGYSIVKYKAVFRGN